MQELSSALSIEVGRKVYTNLYARGPGVIYAVHGAPGVVKAWNVGGVMHGGGSCHVDIVFESGGRSLQLPECILLGVQWRLIDEVVGAERIAELLANAASHEASEKAKAEEDKKAYAAAKVKAQAENKHLLLASEVKGGALQAAAKNIRIELKAAFPGIKFSVRTDRFSGGDSIDVSWTDGPNSAQVDAIINKYAAGYFNGMEDIYESVRSPWTDLFGDAKYVHSRRENSDAAIAAAIRTVKAVYAGNLAQRGIEEISVADYRGGKLMTVEIMDGGWSDYWSLQSIIYRTLIKRTWSVPKAAKKQEAKGE